MAYTFTVDGEIYTGRTIPGAARMRIFHQSSNSFVAAFDPDNASILGSQPAGCWVDVLPSTDVAWLKKIEPDVLIACRDRRLFFKKANEKKGE